MNKIKTVVVGDSLSQTTGFSYVISSILKRMELSGEFDLHYITISGKDSVPEHFHVQGDDFATICKGLKVFNAQMTDQSNLQNFESILSQIEPDLVITSHDPWMLDPVAFSPSRDSFVWIAYSTIETPHYPEFILQPSPYLPGDPRKPIGWILRSADAVIPHVQMGYTALKSMGVPVTLPVYTGLDLELAYTEPPPKEQVFSGVVTEETFVFMTMGANGARKCMDRILHSFAKFLNKMSKPEQFKLYMHTDLSSALGGADLRTIAEELGITGNVMYTPSNRYGAGINKQELYQKYAASDCYIGLPGGEGFGYGFAEAMMHGLPLIYIDHGGHVDYCKDAGLPVKVKDYVYARNTGIQWALADTDDAAKAMARLVSDKKLHQKLSERGKEIVRTELDWNTVYPKWEETVLEQYYTHKENKVPGFLKRVF